MRTFLICLSLAALTWIVFGQTLGHGFINLDDDVYVYENPLVSRGLSDGAVLAAFNQFHSNF
jgi:hypothetical protein